MVLSGKFPLRGGGVVWNNKTPVSDGLSIQLESSNADKKANSISIYIDRISRNLNVF